MESLPDGTYILDQPVQLPEVLDILIVGGGPAGTAAAFRAKELGLSFLVIDYDDLMKRIRDYAKDKPILPSFGGGDQMKFPVGGEMISSLHFPPIQKDEMCTRWKGLYRRYNVPAKIGVELMGLESDQAGQWRAKIWNHNTKTEESLSAHHVVIAFGRGAPRRFDIPGRVESIAYRLTDPSLQVGKPACVIGGGTSAAEAVIAISNAKRESDDSTAVYWSYRGDRMPKVSKALADVFFQAYVGNGNIRYLPRSEPVSVITNQDQENCLCLRIDRKVMSDRPQETTQLEFLTRYSIACIGEDIPEALLNSVEIYLTSGGPRNRKRLVVNPLMETNRTNLYLVGDILSPAYLQTEDFDADPSTFQEVKRRGNVKSALRDGVWVTEVIAQKLEGKTNIHVRLEFADAKIEESARPGPTEAPLVEKPAEVTKTTGEDRQPAARLVRLLQGQITAEEYLLAADGVTTIGRQGCDVCFEDDSSLSDHHASILHREQAYFVQDEGSENGVFLQPIEGKAVAVPPGAILRAGSQWLIFGNESDPHLLTHYDSQGNPLKTIRLREGKIILGRQAPDVTLDPSDPNLSRRHLSISLRDGKLFFSDLKSTNGTHFKVDGPVRLSQGDRVWLGHQILQFQSAQESVPPGEVRFETTSFRLPEPPVRPTAELQAEAAAKEAGPTVTFQDSGQSFPIRKGQTICELAEEHGLKITAQCHQGICGSDPIRVISGNENLNPLGEDEEDTLEGRAPEGESYRLACVARPRGPVVVEIVKD